MEWDGVVECTAFTQDRDMWRAFMNRRINLRVR